MKMLPGIFVTMAVCLVSAAPGAARADTPYGSAPSKLNGKLVKLIRHEKLKKAAALADEKRGKDWCPAGEPERFALASTLGVLARRVGREERSIDCVMTSINSASKPREAAAALFELSRLVDHVAATKLDEVTDRDTGCGIFNDELDKIFEPWKQRHKDPKKKAQEFLGARAETRKRALEASLRLNPTAPVARRLAAHQGLEKDALASILRGFAGTPAARVYGPFETRKRAQASFEELADADKSYSPPTTKKPSGHGDEKTFRAWTFEHADDCDASTAVAFALDGSYFYVPLLLRVYDTRCGGYGSSDEVTGVKWPKKKEIFEVRATEDRYINEPCGSSGHTDVTHLFCRLDGHRRVPCLQLGTSSRWVHGEGRFDVGLDAKISSSGNVSITDVAGPRELRRKLKKLDGTPLSELPRKVDATIEKVAAEMLRKH